MSVEYRSSANVVDLLTDRQREWMGKVAAYLGYSDLTQYAHYLVLNDLGWAADQTSLVEHMGEKPADWEDMAALVRGNAHATAKRHWKAARRRSARRQSRAKVEG